MRFSKGKLILFSIITVLFFIFFFLSSIVRYWVVKNSEELIGRKLEIAELHFNYLKVSVRIQGFTLYEHKSEEKFVSFDELYVNFEPWRLLSGEYSVSQVYLNGLNLLVIQGADGFNFDDLMAQKEEQPVDSLATEEKTEALKFAIQNIEFKNGRINYQNTEKANEIDLDSINLALPLIAWNNEKSEMGVNFSLGEEGRVGIDANVDHAKNRYLINLMVSSVDLHPFVAYLGDYMNVSEIAGKVSTQLAINGSMQNVMDIWVNGKASVSDFFLKDVDGNRFIAVKLTTVDLDSLNVGTSYYHLGKLRIEEPEIYASLYPKTTNIEQIFQPYFQSDSIVTDSVATEEELFYQIDSISVVKGSFNFSDHSLNRNFVYDMNDINIEMGTLSEKEKSIPLTYSIRLNESGKSTGKASFNLNDFHTFSFQGSIEKLELMSFSPYSEFYIARPITQGEFNYDCSIEMNPKELTNNNKIRINELDFGGKTKDPNTIKAPVRLALYLLKDQNDVIDFDLPVSGNPSDPKFKLGKIVWKTLMNFLVKTASQPFNILGNLAGANPESIQKIPFQLLQDSLTVKQKKSLNQIALILKKKPELKFNFTQETNLEEEEGLMSIKECVARYHQSISSPNLTLSNADLVAWANSNPEFAKYIGKDSTLNGEQSIQDLCSRQVGAESLKLKFSELLTKRNAQLSSYLKDSLLVNPELFEVKTADLRNLSEEQKAPSYRVEVSLK